MGIPDASCRRDSTRQCSPEYYYRLGLPHDNNEVNESTVVVDMDPAEVSKIFAKRLPRKPRRLKAFYQFSEYQDGSSLHNPQTFALSHLPVINIPLHVHLNLVNFTNMVRVGKTIKNLNSHLILHHEMTMQTLSRRFWDEMAQSGLILCLTPKCLQNMFIKQNKM